MSTTQELQPYATIDDVQNLTGNTYTEAQQERISELLVIVSDRLRQYAYNAHQDLDYLIADGRVLPSVVKSIVVDVVVRALMTPTESNEAPMTQFSQSALGYSVSGTYLVPGGGIFIKNSELKALGLLKQKFGVIEFYDTRHKHKSD